MTITDAEIEAKYAEARRSALEEARRAIVNCYPVTGEFYFSNTEALSELAAEFFVRVILDAADKAIAALIPPESDGDDE